MSDANLLHDIAELLEDTSALPPRYIDRLRTIAQTLELRPEDLVPRRQLVECRAERERLRTSRSEVARELKNLQSALARLIERVRDRD